MHRVSAIETPRLPLSAYKKDNAFKLYLNDVGLLGRKFDLDATTILMGDNLFTEFKGGGDGRKLCPSGFGSPVWQ